jgi:Na+/H+ antiporter NhaD/arsenite permease-like protein
MEEVLDTIKLRSSFTSFLPGLISALLLTVLPVLAFASEGAAAVRIPPVYAVIPFVLLLLCIAIVPLKFGHFWEHNKNKALVVAVVSLPILVYYMMVSPIALWKSIEDYIGFIILLWSLYTISGGIVLRGNLLATPKVNTIFLATGAVAANLFGTTGASMLLIRPLLATNQERKFKVHTVVFFIFLVSNVGGSLTPLGDPPLYMGFMKGVPFQWTLQLWPEWLFMVGSLLLTYFLWDRRAYKKEKPADIAADYGDKTPLRVDGKVNFLFIVGVMATTILSGRPEINMNPFVRDAILVGMGLLSMIFTKKQLRKDNDFNFGAIIEVAVLFIGIFITMIPALELLEMRGGELGITQPWQYFWTAGALSSFLDNTPTYLTFLELAKGTLGFDNVLQLIADVDGAAILKAISLGAVFMGANSYIGNGPNFMVKAIAEQKGRTQVNMPSFGGYMVYSVGILVPLFMLVTLLFFGLKIAG